MDDLGRFVTEIEPDPQRKYGKVFGINLVQIEPN